MAQVSVQLKRIATQAAAEADFDTVLLDGQAIYVKDTGRLYFGNDNGDPLGSIVQAGQYLVPSSELAGYLQDGASVGSLTFSLGGLRIRDSNNSQTLAINVGEDLTQNRTLTLIVNQADRTLTLAGDATISGTNTGDAASDPVGSAAAAQAAAAIDATAKANAAENNAKAYSDAQVVSVFRIAGSWDASTGAWPTVGTGTGGGIRRGDSYNVSVAGIISGRAFDVGDVFYANQASPGQLSSNWMRFEANTDQATEVERGTGKVATQATVENDATTNDTDIVTPRKLWQAIVKSRTLSGFFSAVRGVLLAGIVDTDATDVTSADSIIVAFGKLKRRLNDLITTVAAKADPSVFFELTYTGGDQSNSTLTVADVHSSTEMTASATGWYEGEYSGNYTSAATTTGIGLGVYTGGGLAVGYFSQVVVVDAGTGDKGAQAWSGANNILAAATSRTTSAGGNHFVIRFRMRVTTPGTVRLRFVSEVNASAVTITAVRGFLKRDN